MSENGLTAARNKMRDAGIAEQAIDVFSHYYRALDNGATCLIPEDSIEPLTRIDSIEDVEIDEAGAREALSRTVLISTAAWARRWGWTGPSRCYPCARASRSSTCWSIR